MGLDYDFFYKWVRKNLDIDLNAYKEKQLQRRIATVMRSSGATNLEEYSRLIKKDEEIKKIFLDYITINVTEFFRNREIFKEFESILITDIIPKFKSIKMWSAACSIGAEPYTLAMILDKNNLNNKGHILGTDIDDNVLKRAREGIYKENEMKNLTKEEIRRYFTFENDKYHIDEKLKKMVSFKKHDLILDNYEKGFHAIICRNVTIYFKNETKDMIYKKMYESLVPGGVLFTGATESIYNPGEFGFKKISTFIYEKV